MVATTELIVYIKGLLHQGRSREEIRQTLLTRGWNASDVDSSFEQLYAGDVTLPSKASPTLAERHEAGKKFFAQLFSSMSVVSVRTLILCFTFWALGMLTMLGVTAFLNYNSGSAAYAEKVRQYPEIGLVSEEITSEYGPDSEVFSDVNVNKVETSDGQQLIRRIFLIGVISKDGLDGEGRKKIGIQVCSILAQRNMFYDIVEVKTVKRVGTIITRDTSKSEGHSCPDWENNPVTDKD